MSTVTTTAAEDSPDDDGRRMLVRWLRPEGAVVGVDEPLCKVGGGQHACCRGDRPQAGVLRHLVRTGGSFVIGDAVFRLDPLL